MGKDNINLLETPTENASSHAKAPTPPQIEKKTEHNRPALEPSETTKRSTPTVEEDDTPVVETPVTTPSIMPTVEEENAHDTLLVEHLETIPSTLPAVEEKVTLDAPVVESSAKTQSPPLSEPSHQVTGCTLE
jgi:hypothetical protein